MIDCSDDFSTLTISNILDVDEGDYWCRVIGPNGQMDSNTARLTVRRPPVISVHPISIVAPVGAEALFVLELESGTPPFRYVWETREFGTSTWSTVKPITSNLATDSYYIEPLALASAGDYRCKVRNSASIALNQTGDSAMDFVYSDIAMLTVWDYMSFDPPDGAQPVNTTVNYGTTASFSARVSGTLDGLEFTWLDEDGNDVTLVNPQASVATDGPTTTLYIPDATNDDEGGYRVRATTVYQSGDDAVYSAFGYLEVRDPVITRHPQSVATFIGANISFTVEAAGSSLNYAWYKSGSGVVLSVTDTLTISSVNFGHVGAYFCRVTGADGTVDSDFATLNITNPAIVSQPANITVDPGDSASFTVTIWDGSSKPLPYSWRKDGALIPGSNGVLGFADGWSITYTIPSVVKADEGVYTVFLDGPDKVESNPATLSVNDPPIVSSITVIPSSAVAAFGTTAFLTVNVDSGTLPFTYLWVKDGTSIAEANVTGKTSATLTITDAVQANEGVYECRVFNSAGEDSAQRMLYTGALLAVAQHPQSLIAYQGEAVEFIVLTTGGRGARQYQWKRDVGAGPQNVGTNANELALSDVQLGDAGSYWCEVTDERGTLISNAAELTVGAPLSVSVAWPEQTVAVLGSAFTLAAQTAGGFPPLVYDWTKNGESLDKSGYVDGNAYHIPLVDESDEGDYVVTVSDAHTGVISFSTTLVTTSGVPAAGLAGLALLGIALSALGAARLTKKAKQ